MSAGGHLPSVGVEAAHPAPERQIDNGRTLALTHNLGGYPGEMVSFVSVVGTERD